MVDIDVWSYEDFIGYLLVFASEEDYEVNEEEKAYLISRLGEDKYKRFYTMINNTSLIEQMDNITTLSQKFCTNDTLCQKVLKDVRELFMSNDDFSALEQTIMVGLEKLVSGHLSE